MRSLTTNKCFKDIRHKSSLSILLVLVLLFSTLPVMAVTFHPTPVLIGSNANLKSLTSSLGSLTPAFDPATTSYTQGADFTTTSFTLCPTADASGATISINNTTIASGESKSINLATGANTFAIKVLAANGITTKTYTLTVTRKYGFHLISTNALLSGLITNAGDLTPAFDPNGTAYTQTYYGPNIYVKPTVQDASATITVNGTAATSGEWSQLCTLSPGSNTITTVVTAEDGTTTKTYTISITMPGGTPSADANLSSLTTADGSLSPVFNPAAISYTVGYTGSDDTFQLTPTASESHAAITVNGAAATSGAISQAIPLVAGNNPVAIVVTAQNGTTTKTYNVIVNKLGTQLPPAPVYSADLISLALSTGTMTPAFAPAATSYTQSAVSSVSSVIVTPTADDASAIITVNGTAVTSGHSSSAIGLSAGTNTITVKLTAGDGVTTKTYTVVINVAAAASQAPPLPPPSTISKQVLIFTIGSTSYILNDQFQSMDTAPIIKAGRTLLPIRYVATPLGAVVDWNQNEQKVTVSFNSKIVELWIGNPTAKVNGVSVPIDPNNTKVAPIVVPPGRTMLPLRFIAENLGCEVVWKQTAREATVTYPKP